LPKKQLSAAQLAQRRAAAHSLHALYDSRDLTRAARRANRERYGNQVRAEHPNLRPAEVARRARHLEQAHMQTISLAGVRARQRKAAS